MARLFISESVTEGHPDKLRNICGQLKGVPGMKKTFPQFLIVVAIFVLALFFGSCNESKKNQDRAKINDTNGLVIRSSIVGVAYDNQLYIAQEKGFIKDEFDKDNISLEFIRFANGPAVNEALIAGELDIAHAIGDQPMITGIVGGTDSKALATLSRQTATLGIYVAGDSEIKSVKDLKGKAVAVAVGTFMHKCVIGVLEENGIREDDINLVNLSSINEDLAALESKDIVGFAGHFSTTYPYIKQGKLRQLVSFENYPAYTFLEVRNNFINKYPEVTQRLLDVLVRTTKWVAENPEETARIVADYTEQDYDAIIELRKQVDFYPDITSLDIAQFRYTYDFLEAHDYISKRLDDINILYDDSFIKKSLQNVVLKK